MTNESARQHYLAHGPLAFLAFPYPPGKQINGPRRRGRVVASVAVLNLWLLPGLSRHRWLADRKRVEARLNGIAGNIEYRKQVVDLLPCRLIKNGDQWGDMPSPGA